MPGWSSMHGPGTVCSQSLNLKCVCTVCRACTQNPMHTWFKCTWVWTGCATLDPTALYHDCCCWKSLLQWRHKGSRSNWVIFCRNLVQIDLKVHNLRCTVMNALCVLILLIRHGKLLTMALFHCRNALILITNQPIWRQWCYLLLKCLKT